MTALKDLAWPKGWPPEAIRQTLETMLEQARILYGAGWQPPADLERNAAERLPEPLTRASGLEWLLGWLAAPAPAEAEAPTPGRTAAASPPQPEGFFAKLWKRLRGA